MTNQTPDWDHPSLEQLIEWLKSHPLAGDFNYISYPGKKHFLGGGVERDAYLIGNWVVKGKGFGEKPFPKALYDALNIRQVESWDVGNYLVQKYYRPNPIKFRHLFKESHPPPQTYLTPTGHRYADLHDGNVGFDESERAVAFDW